MVKAVKRVQTKQRKGSVVSLQANATRRACNQALATVGTRGSWLLISLNPMHKDALDEVQWPLFSYPTQAWV